jgi:polyketide cyclase/dehydrase/lipid transport protein
VIEAEGELQAPRGDVWALVAEPYHLPDWWPGYQGVEPDRRGLAVNARWEVLRSTAPGLLRRPGGRGLIVITRVVEGYELRWRDVQQGLECGVALDNAGSGRSRAVVGVDGSWPRILLEGGRSLPRKALARLVALCQTAAGL